jgi:hypothetical protein
MQSEPILNDEVDTRKFPPPKRSPSRRLVFYPEREHSARSSIEARQRIDEFIKSASPGAGSETDPSHEFNVGALEKNLRDLERSLFEREQNVQEREVHLLERERTLWESEALLYAREDLMVTREKQIASVASAATATAADPEELKALEHLRDEVARQEDSLKQQKLELSERERFIEDSENILMGKTMQQQEEECRLEQISEDLNARELRINALEGKPPPPEEPKEVL